MEIPSTGPSAVHASSFALSPSLYPHPSVWAAETRLPVNSSSTTAPPLPEGRVAVAVAVKRCG